MLLDPPYASGLYEKVLETLLEKRLMAPGCIILAEHPAKQPIKAEFVLLKKGKPHRYGDIAVTKYVFEPAFADDTAERAKEEL